MKRTAEKFWMVYVEGNRPPQFKHATAESAIKEAHRLATKEQVQTYVLAVIAAYAPSTTIKTLRLVPIK